MQKSLHKPASRNGTKPDEKLKMREQPFFDQDDKYTAGNAAILARMRNMAWKEYDGTYVTQIAPEYVDRYHTFFKLVGDELREKGKDFANVESGGSRIVTVPGSESPWDPSEIFYEIRLSKQDMELLNLKPAVRERG